MYGTRLIVPGLSLVQFCGNWKSPWSTRSEVVKTAWDWDQVKMHEKLWAIRLSIQCYWSVLCNQQPSLLKSCQGSSCHVYIETNFSYDMPQHGIIQWLLWLNYSHIHACTASTKAKSPLDFFGWHGLFWFGLGPLFGTLCLAVSRCSGSKWWTTWYVCCEKEGGHTQPA